MASFRLYLKRELQRRCQKNPSYSLRAFARFLHIPHQVLSRILNGKRPPTKTLLEKIGEKLQLDESVLKKFRAPIGKMKRSKPK
jgi:transcriptional regulator with XRE-family HTH domain